MYKTSTIQWFYIQTSSKHRVMIPRGLSCTLPNPAIAAEFFTSSSKSCYCSRTLYRSATHAPSTLPMLSWISRSAWES